MAPTKLKSTPKAKLAKAKLALNPKVSASKVRKANASKAKSSRGKAFKPNSFFGLSIELRQFILSYTITDQDLDKHVLRQFGKGSFVFGSYYFKPEKLRD